MLPPIPPGLMPITSQTDEPEPLLEIPPVSAAQRAASESAASLDRRHPQDALGLAARRRRRAVAPARPAPPAEEPADAEEAPRLGGTVDVTV